MSKSVGIRMSEDTIRELEDLCARYSVTKGDFMRIAVESVVEGYVHIADGKMRATEEETLISCGVHTPKGKNETIVATDFGLKTAESLDFTDVHTPDYESLGFGRVLRAFEKNGYPERVIRQMNDSNASMIHDAGRYNPKRYRDDWA